MKVAGIIAEYNPFHNGHQYHIEETKKRTGADYIIAVMSGDYVQRGAPAFLGKEHRTRMALMGGADLVIELPFPFATASAEDFALYGVSLLQATGVTNFLSFGCEEDNLSLLKQIASLCLEEPPAFQEALKASLKQGEPFPKARQKALKACCPELEEISLSLPNLILAVEYIKALIKLHSSITPILISRCDHGYHSEVPMEQYASASAIRGLCMSSAKSASDSEGPVSALSYMPRESYEILSQVWNQYAPVCGNDISQALGYRLLACRNGNLTQYADISPELSHRIVHHMTAYTNFESFSEQLKTKAYTRTRIQRALLHLLFSITKEDMKFWKEGTPSYIRILGFRKSAGPLLSALQREASVPVLKSLAGYDKVLSPKGKELLEKELFVSHFYYQTAAAKFQSKVPKDEFRRPLVIL